jgi:hypothetical protein
MVRLDDVIAAARLLRCGSRGCSRAALKSYFAGSTRAELNRALRAGVRSGRLIKTGDSFRPPGDGCGPPPGAARPAPSVPPMADNKSLECPVCLGGYANPVTLVTCRHILCLGCACELGFRGNHSTIQCPMCAKSSTDVHLPPHNRTLWGMCSTAASDAEWE